MPWSSSVFSYSQDNAGTLVFLYCHFVCFFVFQKHRARENKQTTTICANASLCTAVRT